MIDEYPLASADATISEIHFKGGGGDDAARGVHKSFVKKIEIEIKSKYANYDRYCVLPSNYYLELSPSVASLVIN